MSFTNKEAALRGCPFHLLTCFGANNLNYTHTHSNTHTQTHTMYTHTHKHTHTHTLSHTHTHRRNSGNGTVQSSDITIVNIQNNPSGQLTFDLYVAVQSGSMVLDGVAVESAISVS